MAAYSHIHERSTLWKRTAHTIDETFKYWAVIPAILILVVFTIFPIGQLLWMSVSELEFSQKQLVATFVGVKHLSTAFHDVVVPVAWKNTFIFVFWGVYFTRLIS